MRLFTAAALALLSLFTLPLGAQSPDLATPAGQARIVSNADGTKDVLIGKTRVDLPEDAYLAFFDARVGNLLLVLHSPGGNACNGYYTWVHASPGDIRRSPSFGTCAERGEITWDAETVRVTMPANAPGEGDITFIYDGKGNITTAQAGLAHSGVSSPAGWEGRYPFELVSAGEMQGQLRALLGAEWLLEVQRVMELAGPMARDGKWVAGSGCAKHACDTEQAAVAINLQDGRLLVALKRAGQAPVLWGNAAGALPRAVAEVMAGK